MCGFDRSLQGFTGLDCASSVDPFGPRLTEEGVKGPDGVLKHLHLSADVHSFAGQLVSHQRHPWVVGPPLTVSESTSILSTPPPPKKTQLILFGFNHY